MVENGSQVRVLTGFPRDPEKMHQRADRYYSDADRCARLRTAARDAWKPRNDAGPRTAAGNSATASDGSDGTHARG